MCYTHKRLHQLLVDGGILDSDGLQSITPTESNWEDLLPGAVESYEIDIRWVLKVHFATHAFSSRYVEEMISFLESQ